MVGECHGVKLGVELAPGGQPEPGCLLAEGHIVGQAGEKGKLLLGRGNDEQVCQHVWPSLWLIGAKGASIHRKAPDPFSEGADELFPGLPGQGQVLALSHLDL